MKYIFIIIVLFVACVDVSAQFLDINALTEKAEDGDVEALELLGECYYNGTGMDKKYYDKAIPYLKQAAGKGSSKSMFYLYQCYNFGRGVTENETEATSWLRKAAIAGHEVAFEHYVERFPNEKDEIVRLQEQWKKEHSYKVEVTSENNLVFTVNDVSFTMIYVPGGTFTMGATSEQGRDAAKNESPTHQVTLSSFHIGQTEVTQDLWQTVMGCNPSNFKGNKRPVERVSWDDCQTFINKLNSMTGLRFRLPTEAEWEFAARGGKSGGTKYAGSSSIDIVAWYGGNNKSSNSLDYGTRDVATKQPNGLGIYDMTGNVWEWCQDWRGSYSSDSQTNPQGPSKGSSHVSRGGCWSNAARSCRVSCRLNFTQDCRVNFLGLRLAL